MTIDEVIVDAISKTTNRSTLVAAYAIRREYALLGYVEARLNPHGSTNPLDWESTWIAYWQQKDGRLGKASSEDLEALLERFGAVDLTPTMLGAPVAFVQQCKQTNAPSAETMTDVDQPAAKP